MPGSKLGTVLLVDDDPDILQSYGRLIEARIEGAKVLRARSADEALKMLGRQTVDLILADYRMPEMDGITFLAEARRINPRIRRVIFTAYAEPELARRASAEAMVDDFVSKDVDPEELLKRIRRVMDRPRTN